MRVKVRYFLVVAGSIILLALVFSVVLTQHQDRKQPVFTDAQKLISAVQAFARDLKAQGQPLQAAVPLRKLLEAGYLATNDVSTFEGMEVQIFFAL